jgi:hypothetical protein
LSPLNPWMTSCTGCWPGMVVLGLVPELPGAQLRDVLSSVDQDCGMSLVSGGGSGVPCRLRMLVTASRKVWSTSAG